MSTPFKQTTRSLNSERHRLITVPAFILLVVTGLWVWWFGAGQLPVHRQGTARVVAVAEPYLLTVHRDGRVAEHGLTLNRRVRRGDLLVRLDQVPIQKALEQAEADVQLHRETLNQTSEALKRHNTLTEATLNGADLRLEQARLAVTQHELSLRAAEDKLARFKRLRERGEIAELDYLELEKATREARQQETQLQLARDLRAEERIQAETKADNDRELLVKQQRQAERDIRVAETERQRLLHERDQYEIKAPVDGILAEIQPLQKDRFLTAGHELGRLLAEETMMVRAYFNPAEAVGRIKSGDTAEMRLDGFSWLEYGTLQLRVREVAGEWRNGRLRIDFDILAAPASIPLQHGLPGRVLVKGETITPLQMVLRSVGGTPAPAGAEVVGQQP